MDYSKDIERREQEKNFKLVADSMQRSLFLFSLSLVLLTLTCLFYYHFYARKVVGKTSTLDYIRDGFCSFFYSLILTACSDVLRTIIKS